MQISKIAGRFQLGEKIGEGGFGEIRKAIDTETN